MIIPQNPPHVKTGEAHGRSARRGHGVLRSKTGGRPVGRPPVWRMVYAYSSPMGSARWPPKASTAWASAWRFSSMDSWSSISFTCMGPAV